MLKKKLILAFNKILSNGVNKILEKLGEGGMGVVYKAEDTKRRRDVAIKFLPWQIAASEEERQHFKIEAQASAALNRPNITHVYAIENVTNDR